MKSGDGRRIITDGNRASLPPPRDGNIARLSRHMMAAERRSTIESHPDFPEAPHSKSSIPHSKTDFNKNEIASR